MQPNIHFTIKFVVLLEKTVESPTRFQDSQGPREGFKKDIWSPLEGFPFLKNTGGGHETVSSS